MLRNAESSLAGEKKRMKSSKPVRVPKSLIEEMKSAGDGSEYKDIKGEDMGCMWLDYGSKSWECSCRSFSPTWYCWNCYTS